MNYIIWFVIWTIFNPLMASTLILSCPHEQIPFQIEIAKTSKEKAKGLMNRESLGESDGMLFLSSKPRTISMWMKNTSLSLDMIFFNQKGKILAIIENATPYSTKPIGPIPRTFQVLELLGGTVKKRGLTKACTISAIIKE